MKESLELMIFKENDVKKVNVKKNDFIKYFEKLKGDYSKNGYYFESGIIEYDKFCSYLYGNTMKAKKCSKLGNNSIDDFLNLELNIHVFCEFDVLRFKKSIMAASKCYKESNSKEKILLIGKILESTPLSFKKKYNYDFMSGLSSDNFDKMENDLPMNESDIDFFYYLELMLSQGKSSKRFDEISRKVARSYALIRNYERKKNNNESKISELSCKINQVRLNYYNFNNLNCNKKLVEYKFFNI